MELCRGEACTKKHVGGPLMTSMMLRFRRDRSPLHISVPTKYVGISVVVRKEKSLETSSLATGLPRAFSLFSRKVEPNTR